MCKINNLLYFFILFFFMLTNCEAKGGRVPRTGIPQLYPGEIIGSSQSTWIAPYVSKSTIQVGDSTYSTVTWFSEGGEILKRLENKRVMIYDTYVLYHENDTTFVISTYDTLVTKIPEDTSKKHLSRKYVRGSRSIFVYEKYLKNGNYYTDYFNNNGLVGTYGPHRYTNGSSFSINKLGYFAYTIKDSTEENSDIIICDPLGEKIYKFSPERPVYKISISPINQTVFVNYHKRGSKHSPTNDYDCYYTSGKKEKFKIKDLKGLGEFLPNTTKMMYYVSIGESHDYVLVDWQNQKRIWEIQTPIDYIRPMTSQDGFAYSDEYLIISGLAIRESIPHGPVIPNKLKGTIRMLAAIDIETGELVAKWYEPTFTGRWIVGSTFPPMPNRGGKLMWYQGELYHVTDENFSKIIIEDIKNFQNGWIFPNRNENLIHNVLN